MFKEHGVCPMLTLTLFEIYPSKGSRDVSVHSTIWYPICHCTLVCISSHFRDNGPKRIGVMTLTFIGHVTSSVRAERQSARVSKLQMTA